MGIIWFILLLVAAYRLLSTTGQINKSYLRFREKNPEVFRSGNNSVLLRGNGQLVYTCYLLRNRFKGIGELEKDCEKTRSVIVINLIVVLALFLVTLVIYVT